jgi:hypothetical protein
MWLDQHRTPGSPKNLGRDAAQPVPSGHAEAAAAYGYEGLLLVSSPSDFENGGDDVSLLK